MRQYTNEQIKNTFGLNPHFEIVQLIMYLHLKFSLFTQLHANLRLRKKIAGMKYFLIF